MKPKINLKKLSLKRGSDYYAIESFVSAQTSHGDNVNPRDISVHVTADVMSLGDYPVLFSFVDPYTDEKVAAMTMVSIVD